MRTLSRPLRLARSRTPATRPFRWIDAVFRVHQDRKSLSHLPDHMRRDIGLSDREIEEEIRRPFWDIPDWWR